VKPAFGGHLLCAANYVNDVRPGQIWNDDLNRPGRRARQADVEPLARTAFDKSLVNERRDSPPHRVAGQAPFLRKGVLGSDPIARRKLSRLNRPPQLGNLVAAVHDRKPGGLA
jgi:hypothetical protein